MEGMGAHPIDELLQEACRQVAAGLRVPMAKLALTQEGTDDLLLKATVGIPEDLLVTLGPVLPGGRGSAMGYCVQSRKPVISHIPTETRFDPSELVRRAGVIISANVVIWLDGKPYGCLEADSRDDQETTEDDVEFLQIYADLVSAAIQRSLMSDRIEALASERQILLNEVFHRVKNLLANVLAITRRTARHSETVDEFRRSLEGRIGALARAHDLILNAPSKPAHLRELVELEFDAKGLDIGEQFSVDGPDLICGPRTIQALALMMFELATNAVKHGALSDRAPSSASIRLTWRVDDSEHGSNVVLNWRERGVRPAQSSAAGFGSELLQRFVPQMLGGHSRFDMHDDGVEYEISFSTAQDAKVASDSARV